MRVLLTTDTVGGVWAFTCELTTELLRRGHNVALVSFGCAPSEHQQQWIYDRSKFCGSRFVSYFSDAPLEWALENEHTFSKGVSVLLEACVDFQPDLLHSNQFCWGALDLSVPIVVTAHSDVLSWAEACRPNGLEDDTWLCRYKRLVQTGVDGASAIAAPTAWMAEALRRNFRLGTSVQVIPNGRSISAHVGHRKLQAVSAGRLWDEAKGLATLLEVNSPVPMVVAGEPDANQGTTTSLTFAGQLGPGEVVELFSSSSIYIAASFYEPFGLAPLEAALCGCAILARNLPSFHEIWGDAAIYFRNTYELESALANLAAVPDHLEEKRRAAYERATFFTAEKMTGRYLDLYRHLLDEPSASICESEVPAYAS